MAVYSFFSHSANFVLSNSFSTFSFSYSEKRCRRAVSSVGSPNSFPKYLIFRSEYSLILVGFDSMQVTTQSLHIYVTFSSFLSYDTLHLNMLTA